MTIKLCKKIDQCRKIDMIKDKDMLDFQFVESVKAVCAKCKDNVTDLERLEIAVKEAEKLWKLYQIRLQILRERLK